jgi:integrase
MKPCFHALKKDIGSVNISVLGNKFDEYLQILKREKSPMTKRQRKPATINRYISCAKMVCNFAIKNELLSKNPMVRFSKDTEEERDRVLSDAERLRLLNTLEHNNSYLYWPVYFSLKNPIRKGDLFSLTKENLDMFKPWVHFYARKTRRRRFRETCLPFIDEKLMHYFNTLPADCDLLFPNIEKGEYKKPIDFRKHWSNILEEAKIENFRFHDLKHCAITWMLDAGYSERGLKNLGIQFSDKMIDRYYKHDANKVLEQWKKSDECVTYCVALKAKVS